MARLPLSSGPNWRRVSASTGSGLLLPLIIMIISLFLFPIRSLDLVRQSSDKDPASGCREQEQELLSRQEAEELEADFFLSFFLSFIHSSSLFCQANRCIGRGGTSGGRFFYLNKKCAPWTLAEFLIIKLVVLRPARVQLQLGRILNFSPARRARQ